MTTAAWQGFGFSSEMSRRNFLAYVILTTCLVSGQLPRYVLKGQKVTLKKDITGRPDNILWTHDGNKVVEFNGREERVYDPYKTRVTLDWSSAELHINDLRLEDSGKYELEVFVNQNLEKSDHEVEILDRVAKPTISCKINNIDNSGTLVCSAEPRQPVHLMTFEWHSQGSVHPGPHLQISLGDEHDDKVYSCVVSNPLTSETAAFTAKDCHTTKTSSLALIVAVIVISLLLLIGVPGILCYCRKKQKGSGGTVETDVATPFLRGRSGKSGKVKEMVKKIELQNTVGAKHMTKQYQRPIPGNVEFKQASDEVSTDHDHLSEGSDTQEGHASNKSESAAESADVGQNTSSEQKSFTAPASPGLDKIQHQHHDSSVQKDTDEYQLKEPVKEKQHDAGDSEPSDKSADRSKDMLSEPESSTASDGSDTVRKSKIIMPSQKSSSSSLSPFDAGHNKDDIINTDKAEIGAAETEQLSESADEEKQQDQLNSAAVVSPGAVSKVVSKFESKVKTGQNKDDINNKSTTVEEDPDTQEGHAPNKSESAAESADVNQNPSTEQKSSTAPASPADKVDRDAAEAEQLSESADKETKQDELNSPTVVPPGAVGDLLKFFEGKQNTVQTKDDINNKNTPPEDHLSESSNAESANFHQDTSSEQKSSTTPASPVLDPSKTDKSDSDPEQSSKVSLEKATDPAAAGPDTGPVSEPECAATDKKNPPSGINVQQLGEPADEEKQQGAGDPERSGESADSSEDVGFEVNCPADIARGLVKQRSKKFQKANLDKNKHQPSDGGTDQKDLDEQQLIEPSEKWKQEDVGDPESDDESAERSENVSPEPKSPTAADGSGL